MLLNRNGWILVGVVFILIICFGRSKNPPANLPKAPEVISAPIRESGELERKKNEVAKLVSAGKINGAFRKGNLKVLLVSTTFYELSNSEQKRIAKMVYEVERESNAFNGETPIVGVGFNDKGSFRTVGHYFPEDDRLVLESP